MELIEHVDQLTGSLAKLVGLHIKLARLELTRDAKILALQVGAVLPLVPVALVAYALLTGAAVLFLTRFWPADLALAVVGGLNALIGAFGLAYVRNVGQRRTQPTAAAKEEVVRTLVNGPFPIPTAVRSSNVEPIHG